MYYPQPVYAQAGFAFTPSVAIVGSAVTSNLFVSVGTGQYLFGNYYGQANVSLGITPWFSFSVGVGRPVFYDPLFSYYAVVNVRQNPRWIMQVREAYVLRRDNIALRPPVTYAEQIRVMRSVSITRDVTVIDHRNVAMPLRELAADRIAGRNLRLEHVAEAERRQIQRQATELHQVRQQRAQLERQVAAGRPATRPDGGSAPHSPVASHPAARPEGHPGGHPTPHPGGEGARGRRPPRGAGEREPAARGDAEETPARCQAPGRGGSTRGRQPAARGRERPAQEREQGTPLGRRRRCPSAVGSVAPPDPTEALEENTLENRPRNRYEFLSDDCRQRPLLCSGAWWPYPFTG